MEIIRKFEPSRLRHEYGLDAERLLPWADATIPFAGAYCVVRPNSDSLRHVNMPDDEQEMFIAIAGKATVTVCDESYEMSRGDILYVPAGAPHFIRNTGDEPFHFYTLWWNSVTVAACAPKSAAG